MRGSGIQPANPQMFRSAMLSIALRPAQVTDESFLFELYASTRADEMALVSWNAAQQNAFLKMQFDAQTQYYRTQFPEADYRIILRDEQAIGRLIVDRSNGIILLMDISLLPEARSAGIGTALIQDLQAQAVETGRPLRLHVETFNRALHLYERLGFSPIDESGIYYEMEWRPAGTESHG